MGDSQRGRHSYCGLPTTGGPGARIPFPIPPGDGRSPGDRPRRDREVRAASAGCAPRWAASFLRPRPPIGACKARLVPWQIRDGWRLLLSPQLDGRTADAQRTLPRGDACDGASSPRSRGRPEPPPPGVPHVRDRNGSDRARRGGPETTKNPTGVPVGFRAGGRGRRTGRGDRRPAAGRQRPELTERVGRLPPWRSKSV